MALYTDCRQWICSPVRVGNCW